MPVAGDVEVKTRVRFTGTLRDAVVYTKTLVFFRIKDLPGLTCYRENFTFGLNVSAEDGQRSIAHSVFVNFSYEL